MALATGMNTSFLDRLYKNPRDNGHLHVVGCSYVAKQLDSQEDIVRVIVTEVVDSAFGFLPSQVLRERGRAN